jgi:protein involved in polysaccharide export with SLBB domain
VLDLLQRVGGITPGAEPRDVYVVRPHLGDNQRPEAFHVDLHAIVLRHDHKTNIRLLPFDQVYVGQTRKAQIEQAIPPWMRGAYQAIWRASPDANLSGRER